jgi:hypothetical protein
MVGVQKIPLSGPQVRQGPRSDRFPGTAGEDSRPGSPCTQSLLPKTIPSGILGVPEFCAHRGPPQSIAALFDSPSAVDDKGRAMNEHHVVGSEIQGQLRDFLRLAGLIYSWCKLSSCNGMMRARSKSTPARPYIARLRVFNLLICPSVCPLLQGSNTAFRTASRSWRIVLAKRCIA